MANLYQNIVLNDLPKFSGNPRLHDVNFVQGINVETFIRTLDNYFIQHQITDDVRKLQILFAQIDKEKGDANDLVTCYTGKLIPYIDFTNEFIHMYTIFTSNFTSSEFKCATRTKRNEDEATTPQRTSHEPTRACLKCEQENQIERGCRVDTYCSFCKIRGHTIMLCRKKKSQGKYCRNCNRENSRDTNECYVNQKSIDHPQTKRANRINEVCVDDPDREYKEDNEVSEMKEESE